jgi:peptide/nickel transport system substrate-binding protein
VFKDNPAANLAFSRLELDVVTHFTPAVWELWEVQGLPIRTYFAESPFYIGSGVVMLQLNFARPPLDLPAVRRAVAYATPFEALIDKAYFGYSVRASPAMINHTVPAHAAWIAQDLVEQYGYQFDLEAARRVLDEAGIIDRDGDGVRETPDGARLGPWFLEVPYGWTDWMMMCDMVAENLRAIGMDVTARFPDFAVWEANAHTGAFDIIIRWSAGLGLAHPWNVFRVIMDPRMTGPVGETHPAGNWARYLNPEVVPLIDAIPGETDPERLRAYYRQLQEIALRDVVGIPLFYGAVWYAAAERYWAGWPKGEYPERWMSELFGLAAPALPIFFGLVPAGDDPLQSAWETHLKPLAFPTDEIWEALAEVVE